MVLLSLVRIATLCFETICCGETGKVAETILTHNKKESKLEIKEWELKGAGIARAERKRQGLSRKKQKSPFVDSM